MSFLTAFNSVSSSYPEKVQDEEEGVMLDNDGIGNVLLWYDDIKTYVKFLTLDKDFNNYLTQHKPRYAKNIRFKLRSQPIREILVVHKLEVCDPPEYNPPVSKCISTKKELSIDFSVFPNLQELSVSSSTPVTLVSFKILKNIHTLSIGSYNNSHRFSLICEKSIFKNLRNELKKNPLPANLPLKQAYEKLEPLLHGERSLEKTFEGLEKLKILKVYKNALVPQTFLNEIPFPLEELRVDGKLVLHSIKDYRNAKNLKTLKLCNYQIQDEEMYGLLRMPEPEESEGEEEEESKGFEPSTPDIEEFDILPLKGNLILPPSVILREKIKPKLPLGNLVSLSVVQCDEKGAVDFSVVGKITTLERLELRVRNADSKVGDITFSELTNLKQLRLRCFDVTGASLNCPSLEIMEINCPELCDDAFKSIKVLRYLHLTECKKVRGTGFINCCNSLIKVVLEGMNVFENSVCCLRSTRQLHLLSCGLIKKDDGADFGNLHKVEELVIDSNPDISDYILTNMKKLKVLHLKTCTSFTGTTFSSLKNLKELVISNNSRISGDQVLDVLPDLKILSLNKVLISNDGFESSGFLKKLILRKNKNINEEMFKYLLFLNYLELEYCESMGKNPKKGVVLRSLETLVIRNMTNISDKFFKLMENITKLEVIQCKSVTGKGLALLKELENLYVEACIKFNFKNSFKLLKKNETLKKLYIKNPKSKGIRLQSEIENTLDFLTSYKIEY